MPTLARARETVRDRDGRVRRRVHVKKPTPDAAELRAHGNELRSHRTPKYGSNQFNQVERGNLPRSGGAAQNIRSGNETNGHLECQV
jgi:hypothetical protein